jgi:hypothetical protein
VLLSHYVFLRFPFKYLMTTLAFCLLLVGSSSLYLTGVIAEAPGKKELAECAAQAFSHLKQGDLQIELCNFDILTTVIILYFYPLISSTMGMRSAGVVDEICSRIHKSLRGGGGGIKFTPA